MTQVTAQQATGTGGRYALLLLATGYDSGKYACRSCAPEPMCMCRGVQWCSRRGIQQRLRVRLRMCRAACGSVVFKLHIVKLQCALACCFGLLYLLS
jgi:hypothetical protein